jgi:peptidoglycan/xylan/chitin deacetylase (PgdA/CDA1 family)
MIASEERTGYFLFSLDVELGWGYFDLDRQRDKLFKRDGSDERVGTQRLLELCAEYGIAGTWAVVGHMFYERCEQCEICPLQPWKGKYRTFAEVYERTDPLWYGPDIVDLLLQHGPRQEFGCHGYTHETFDRMTPEQARIEVQEWARVARRKNIAPQTIIFPRNRVGNLQAFKEAGYICYRGDPDDELLVDGAAPRPGVLDALRTVARPALSPVNQVFGLTSPPVHPLPDGPDASGLVNLPASMHFFNLDEHWEKVFDAVNQPTLRMNRMVKGLHKAADEQKIFHVWAHPWEFRTEHDFARVRHLFKHVAELVQQGRMRSITMGDLATQILAQAAVKA